jgi:UDP-GlcNAc3NAcA epimerase
MKILTVVGARPQFVKAAALSREMNNYPSLEEVIVHTGQHYDKNMSEIFFSEMDIPKPNYSLKSDYQTHGAMTGQMLTGIENIVYAEKPDMLLVYGDTNSTLAGALAAKKLHVKLAHVEAGLRSFNMKMPEEINRIVTDRISDLLFCPTELAVNNLKKEGFDSFPCEVINSGDIMEDVALFYSERASRKSTILSQLGLNGKPYILVTLHRAENTDDFESIKQLIESFNALNRKIPVVFPMHPRTRKVLEINNVVCECTVLDPLGYFDMLHLLKQSALVITDSGGLQKEAFFFRKYCLTIRNETEWMELIENGYNFLVGTNGALLCSMALELLEKDFPADVKNLYGNGTAAKKICEVLVKQ